MTERAKNALIVGAFLLAGVLGIRALYDVSTFYFDFKITLGQDYRSINPVELVYFIWYIFLGTLGVLGLALGLNRTSLPERLSALFASIADRSPQVAIAVIAGAVVLFVGAFRAWVLLDAPVADDESTYTFIAQTLLQGRLANPIPEDSTYFANQFVVMNDAGWFGKYPVGHPALLAIGELLETNYFVGPMIAAGSLALTFLVGRAIFGARLGLLAALLLAISPHFLMTGATLLSQTSSTLFMLIGLLATVLYMEGRRLSWGALAGLAWSFGAVIRPLPGVLFLVAAWCVLLFQPGDEGIVQRAKSRLSYLAPVAAAALAALAFMLFVNHAQTGDALKSGYHEVHGSGAGLDMRLLDRKDGLGTMSVVSALLRENFWLLGWPISLAFVGFIKRNRYFPLLASLVAADYLYRIIAPKTVVATTGPIYVTETVPLLALATASGMAEAKRWLEDKGIARAKSKIISSALAASLIALACFWPIQIRSIRAGAAQWRAPYTLLESLGVRRALVFANIMVYPLSGATWAYFPPNPSPSLDDDVLFVRVPTAETNPQAAMIEFSKRRFPDRPAFLFLAPHDGPPQLIPLASQSQ